VWDIAAAKFKVVVVFPSLGFDDVTTNTRFFEPTLRNCKFVRRDRNDSAHGLWGFALRIIRFLSASGSSIISPSRGLTVICARSSEVYILRSRTVRKIAAPYPIASPISRPNAILTNSLGLTGDFGTTAFCVVVRLIGLAPLTSGSS